MYLGHKIIEGQARTRKLLAHELPDPFEGGGIGDIGTARSTSEQRHKPA